MQGNSWHHKLFHIISYSFVLLNLKSAEMKGKDTKVWITWEQKELFRWNKKHFPLFWRATGVEIRGKCRSGCFWNQWLSI